MAHCFVPNVSSDVNARSRVFVFINEGSFQSMNGRVKCQFNDNSQLPIYRKDNYFKLNTRSLGWCLCRNTRCEILLLHCFAWHKWGKLGNTTSHSMTLVSQVKDAVICPPPPPPPPPKKKKTIQSRNICEHCVLPSKYGKKNHFIIVSWYTMTLHGIL